MSTPPWESSTPAIERERETEQMVALHRRHLDSLVRVIPDRERYDEQLERVVVTRGWTEPDRYAQVAYLNRLSREMRARLDPSVKVHTPDQLQRDMADARATKSAADIALGSWRARQLREPGCAPTDDEAHAIRLGESRL